MSIIQFLRRRDAELQYSTSRASGWTNATGESLPNGTAKYLQITQDKTTGIVYALYISSTLKFGIDKSTDYGVTWSSLASNILNTSYSISNTNEAAWTTFQVSNGHMLIVQNWSGASKIITSHDSGSTFKYNEITSPNNVLGTHVLMKDGSVYGAVPGWSLYKWTFENDAYTRAELSSVNGTGAGFFNTYEIGIQVVPGAGNNGLDLIYLVKNNDTSKSYYYSQDSGVTFTAVNKPETIPLDVNGTSNLVNGLSYINGMVFVHWKFGIERILNHSSSSYTPIVNGSSSVSTPIDSVQKLTDDGVNLYTTQRFLSYNGSSFQYGYRTSSDSGQTWTSVQDTSSARESSDGFLSVITLFSPESVAPSDIVLSSASLPESASLGTVVGTLTSNGNNEPLVYSLSGGLADNSAFSISGSDLILNAALDYEAKSSYTVEVSVTDAGSNVFAKEFVISVTDVNEAPFGLALSSTSITENNSVSDIIGSLSASDPEGSGLTFSIVGGADAASFSISGNQLLANEVFDFETKTSYQVQVRATDAGGLSVEGPFIVTILNLVSDDPVSVSSSEVNVLSSGAVITSVAVNPKLVAVTLGGQPLATGSVLRNSETGQKFLKAAGDEFAFVEIELAPKPAWNWSADGQAAWQVLQSL